MRDVVMVATALAFFALCVAYVWWCDRIIGPDAVESADRDVDRPPTVADDEPATASAPAGAASSVGAARP